MHLMRCESIAEIRLPMIRRYSELRTFETFEERFEYLRLGGQVGKDTFGFDRIFNQMFYQSSEWKKVRRDIIVRDAGCDLGIQGREIQGKIYVHHMNPIELSDIQNNTEYLLDPQYLICVSFDTHQAIHYGDKSLLPMEPIERSRNDTCPWKKVKEA